MWHIMSFFTPVHLDFLKYLCSFILTYSFTHQRQIAKQVSLAGNRSQVKMKKLSPFRLYPHGNKYKEADWINWWSNRTSKWWLLQSASTTSLLILHFVLSLTLDSLVDFNLDYLVMFDCEFTLRSQFQSLFNPIDLFSYSFIYLFWANWCWLLSCSGMGV